ncbi:MAG TPA: amino acid permease [Chloroflexi bacterium]|nr:amino acid permease [Chloroflexota bacterium]
MNHHLRNLLFGAPLPTQAMNEKRLNKIRALAVFSPDALSSIAYANQEIYLGLIVAGLTGLRLALPIGLAIAALLTIVALSYYQTIHGYPSGGGSYVVARENLGTLPGLITASALMMDYMLTAAVSVTAGVEAVASAFPALWSHRVILSLIILAIMTWINLRGVRESGTLMALPVYLFLLVYLLMLAYGGFRWLVDGPASLAAVAPPAVQPLTLLLILHAFSAGCTALTGIEAISNGVPAFQPPEAKNAGKTLGVMAILMGILFVGSIGLTQGLAITPNSQETILSALARHLLGSSPFYFLVQISTMLILVVAANTSFAGFPRLAAILAADGFLPRQLTNLGDRLVFSNGILFLSAVCSILIVVFGGNSHALIPLFAVGVFLAFTLSQAGMVLHWRSEHQKRWVLKAILNGLGALVTGITVLIIGFSKFLEGAWITIVLIPVLVVMFLQIQAHYRMVSRQLSLQGLPPSLKPLSAPRIVMPVSGVHRGTIQALNYARSISKDITAVFVEIDPASTDKLRKTWQAWFPDIPLVVVPSPYRSLIGPFLDYLDQTDEEHNDGRLATVLLPEFVPAHWWQAFLHNQTAWLLKVAMLYRRRRQRYVRAIIDIPYRLRK